MSLRAAAAAGSLALALSVVAAPAVMAQDDGPEATVNGLLAAIEAKDFVALPTFFCDEFAADMGGLDLANLTEGMPPGVDADTLLAAFSIDVEIASLEVLSQTDDEAILDMMGSMSLSINEEALPPLIETLLEATGQEVTPDMVDMVGGMMMSEFEAEATDISTEITLVRGETMPWLICRALGGADDTDGEVMEDADASPEASEGE